MEVYETKNLIRPEGRGVEYTDVWGIIQLHAPQKQIWVKIPNLAFRNRVCFLRLLMPNTGCLDMFPFCSESGTLN